MPQLSFGDMEFTNRRRKTKRELFLEQMDKIIPWADWVNMIAAYYPSGKRGRPPIGIETMLRMYLMQNWFSLSDEGIEDAVYDSHAMRSFLKTNFLDSRYLTQQHCCISDTFWKNTHLAKLCLTIYETDWTKPA